MKHEVVDVFIGDDPEIQGDELEDEEGEKYEPTLAESWQVIDEFFEDNPEAEEEFIMRLKRSGI